MYNPTSSGLNSRMMMLPLLTPFGPSSPKDYFGTIILLNQTAKPCESTSQTSGLPVCIYVQELKK